MASAAILFFEEARSRCKVPARGQKGPAVAAANERRIAALDAFSVARPLTLPESVELARLLHRAECRRRRLPSMIEGARTKLDTLLAELSPADRLRELRAETRRSWERLRALEEELEPGRHLRRLEAELESEPAHG